MRKTMTMIIMLSISDGSNGKYLGSVVGGSISPYGYNNRYFGFPVRAVFTFSE